MDRTGWKVTGFLLACFGIAGCGGEPQSKDIPGSYQNLKSISAAYLEATKSLDRPPKDLDELMPYLKKQGDPETLLRSPNDGENYQILWGVDYRSPPQQRGTYPVLAYEQRGKNGKRYVLQIRNVTQMSDEEFKNAPFPPGYKAPE